MTVGAGGRHAVTHQPKACGRLRQQANSGGTAKQLRPGRGGAFFMYAKSLHRGRPMKGVLYVRYGTSDGRDPGGALAGGLRRCAAGAARSLPRQKGRDYRDDEADAQPLARGTPRVRKQGQRPARQGGGGIRRKDGRAARGGAGRPAAARTHRCHAARQVGKAGCDPSAQSGLSRSARHFRGDGLFRRGGTGGGIRPL